MDKGLQANIKEIDNAVGHLTLVLEAALRKKKFLHEEDIESTKKAIDLLNSAKEKFLHSDTSGGYKDIVEAGALMQTIMSYLILREHVAP